jgi:hypothetical protein
MMYNSRLDFFRFSSIVAVLESLKCLWISMCAVWWTIGIELLFIVQVSSSCDMLLHVFTGNITLLRQFT